MERRSSRNPKKTERFSPESAPESAPKRARVSRVEEEIPMDLGHASSSSSSFVDSNRIATGTLTQIHSDSLVPGNLYSIWHKYEKTVDIADPVVGAEAGRPDSKDKYYTRFKGKFVGYDKASRDEGITGISGVTPPLAKLAVFEQVRIISKDKEFFTTDIYLVGKRPNTNIKSGVNVYTFQGVLNPALVAHPQITPGTHIQFKKHFDRHIASGKGRVAFDMDYWSFANDFATLSKNLDSERQLAYNNYALNSFVNPTDHRNLPETTLAMGEQGLLSHVASYLEPGTTLPENIPVEELFNRGSSFNSYVDLAAKYPTDSNKSREQKMEEVDGGSKRRKTRRRKMRKNKTRSKRRRSTRSRK